MNKYPSYRDHVLPPLPRVALTARQWATFAAHCVKALFKQHHLDVAPQFRRWIPYEGVVLDVGAHSGQYAKLFARFAPGGVVYSFEPGRYARSVLMLASALNRAANISILPFALGAAAERLELRVPIKRSGSFGFGLSHLGKDKNPGRTEATEKIDVVTLDQFSDLLGLQRIDLIKADIEGWELQMLIGGAASLEKFRPVLWLEVVDDHLKRAGDCTLDLWAFLAARNYIPHVANGDEQLVRIDAKQDGDILWIPAEKLSPSSLAHHNPP